MTNQPPRFATPHDALLEAIRRLGSQQKAARACDCSAVSVWRWVRDAKPCPQRYVLRLAAASGIAPADLRPDLHWGADALGVPPIVPAVTAPVPDAGARRAPSPVNDNCCCGCCHRSPPSTA